MQALSFADSGRPWNNPDTMKPIALAVLALMVSAPALAQLPARNLSVELRQVDEGGAGYTVGTQPQAPAMPPQQVVVRNGTQARFSLGQTVPVQWVQSVSSHNAKLTAGGAESTSQGGGVTQSLVWMDANQRLAIKPSWPGGNRPATVEVEVESASLGARPGVELPAQVRSQLATTVSAPLNQWVTLAATGRRTAQGVYGSEAASDSRKLLQLRLTLP